MARGAKPVTVIRLTKDGGAKESGFAFIGAQRGGVLMVDARSPQVNTLVVSTKTSSLRLTVKA